MRPPGAGASFDWTCGQGTSVILAETCQPGNSTPRFLAAQRSAVSSLREEVAQRTPWKGFLWTLPETEGPRSLRLPGAARYRDFPSRALLRTFERSLVGGTTNLADPTWRKANFLWKFLCAGAAIPDCGGDPIPTAVPPQGFLQSKNALRRRKTARFAAR